MRSYFVRHTERLLVRDEDFRQLWEEDCVAIHYPDEKSGRRDEDSRSLEPEDYKGKDKTAISRLVELARDGGYVWAESFVSKDKAAKVGFVEPGTEIECRDACWYLRGSSDVPDRRDDYPAVLKTLKLSRGVKSVPRREQMGLRAGKPQQGTIARWNVGDRLADLVEGRPPAQVWANLSTAQHEAACAEFVRESHAERPDLPLLRQLLLPVGRTLQDVDLHGLANDGRQIFGQVTYHRRDSAAVRKKLAALKPYGGEDAYLLFFCLGHGDPEEGGVRFVSADREVEPWLTSKKDYAAAVFGL
jgi:hypothetical protein